MTIDIDVITNSIKEANRLGKEGIRIKSITFIPADTGSSMYSHKVCFETDNGPKSAMETW